MATTVRARSKWIWRGIFLLSAAILFLMILSLLEHRMIYFPEKGISADPSQAGLAFEDVSLRAEDGVDLHGWWVPREGSDLTILFLHGNAGNISHRLGRIDFLHRLEANVLIIDYRGYGKSEGKPSEEGLYLDAQAAYRHLVEQRKIPPERIVCFGKSLGGAVAVDLATRVESAGLIMESAFTSIKDMARRVVPILPAHLLVRSRFDSLEKIPTLSVPILIIHGARDEVIPFDHGQRLFEAAKGKKDFLSIPDAGHNDVLLLGGQTYRDRIRTFLE